MAHNGNDTVRSPLYAPFLRPLALNNDKLNGLISGKPEIILPAHHLLSASGIPIKLNNIIEENKYKNYLIT